MEIAQRNTRLIIAQLVAEVLRVRHRSYYPEMPFMVTIEITVILMTIFWAECNGKPLSARGLSMQLEMPRATLVRRLSFLKSRGEIRREGQRLRVNTAIFATPSRDEAIRSLRQTIIDAGHALAKMDAD